MNEIKNAIIVAKSIHDFVNVIADHNISIADYDDIEFFKPEVGLYVSMVKAWMDNQDINPNKPTVELPEEKVVEPEPVDTTTPSFQLTIKPKASYRRQTKAFMESLAYFVAKNLNNKTMSAAKQALINNFSDVPVETIRKFLNKQTYADISDNYFTIAGKYIKTVDNFPNPTLNDVDKIIKSVVDKPAFDKVINDNFTDKSWKELLQELCDCCWDIGKIIDNHNNDISTTSLVNFEMVKKAALVGRIIGGDLDETDMCIIIGDAIKTVGKRKVTKITSHVKKKWNLTPNMNDIYNVINKKMQPEVCNKFFI